mgnify:CR=1 FL=1
MTLTVPGEQLVVFLLASVRIVSWLVVVPPFAAKALPITAKVVLSVAPAIAVAPAVAGEVPVGTPELILNVLTQVVVGVGMGFVTALLLGAIAAAGSMIDVFGGSPTQTRSIRNSSVSRPAKGIGR